MKKLLYLPLLVLSTMLSGCNSPQLQSGGWIIPMLFGIGAGVFLGNYFSKPKEQRQLRDILFGGILLVIGIVIYIVMSRDKVPVPAI